MIAPYVTRKMPPPIKISNRQAPEEYSGEIALVQSLWKSERHQYA